MPRVGSATADGIVRVGMPPLRHMLGPSRPSGREPEMHGHMYDLGNDNNGDQYLQTTKELQMLVGRKAKKFTAELVQSISSLELEMPEEPARPDEATAGVVTITLWKQAIAGPQGEDSGVWRLQSLCLQRRARSVNRCVARSPEVA